MRPISNICPTHGTPPVPPASRRPLTTTIPPSAQLASGRIIANRPCILNPSTANVYRRWQRPDSEALLGLAVATLPRSSPRIFRAIIISPFSLHVCPQPDQAEHPHAHHEIQKQPGIDLGARVAPDGRQMRLQREIIDSVAEKYGDEVLNPPPQACTQECPAHDPRPHPLEKPPTPTSEPQLGPASPLNPNIGHTFHERNSASTKRPAGPVRTSVRRGAGCCARFWARCRIRPRHPHMYRCLSMMRWCKLRTRKFAPIALHERCPHF